ncbi:MAG: ABC-F family ATP-binding cassette domain-containing protein [Clostridia bacterium]|nr:ABC-F family ATP-binding cassette domain-containing protein [Clostridia bacterium]
MQVSIRNLSFTYDGSYTPVFESVSFNFDTSWRLGLIGRNGKGKTTLLRLLQKQYQYQGHIDMPLTPVYFPYPVDDPSANTREVMLQAAPDAEEWMLICELNQLDVDDSVLDRPFSTLSKGEQTKALLAALFAREDAYPLIDEPTNHLDAHGRALVADYLRRKDGFLLVSHDRAFLNRCIDHVLSLNRSDVWVMQGNYDTWEHRLNQQNEYEQGRNEVLRRDIKHLEESARRTAEWAAKVEKGKYHVPPSVSAVLDRGYVGARAAAMMKKSTNAIARKERAIEEKKSLLHNVEKVGELKLTVLRHPKDVLISVTGGKVEYDAGSPGGSRTVCEDVNFVLRRGERLSLTGPNGCGKSSILKALVGVGGSLTGQVSVAPNLIISYVPQQTDDLTGTMEDFISRAGIDETLFKAILRNMDFTRDLFERPLEKMSQGQKKKLLLARSLCIPAHLYVWDEPLNYIDVLSRVQLEGLLTEYSPTMLLVEHDAVFLERVCTNTLELGGTT